MMVALAFGIVALLPQRSAQWIVGAPELEIGGELSGGPEEFGRIRGLVQLSDGSIIVGDQLNDQVSFFDPAGHVRHVRGRSGSGPGEFRLIKWLGHCGGDSIFVADAGNGRITVFDSSGEMIRTQSLAEPRLGRGVWEIRCDDQHFLAVSPPDHPLPPQPGPFQGAVTIGWFDLESDSVQTLGSFPGPEMYVRPTLTGALPRPLGADVFIAILESRAFVGVSNKPAIEVYGVNGEKLGEFAVPFEVRDVGRADIDAAIDGLLASVSDRRQAAQNQRELRRYQWPDKLPLFTAMVSDPAGYLWMRPYTRSQLNEPVEWKVVNGQGKLVARVAVCSCIEIRQVGLNWVLGIRRSPLGIESVVRLPLERRPGSTSR